MDFLNFLVIDLETTGLNPAEAEIIEIGAVKIQGGQITETFQTLVRPRHSLTAEISDLTGITDDMLADAPDAETALQEVGGQAS